MGKGLLETSLLLCLLAWGLVIILEATSQVWPSLKAPSVEILREHEKPHHPANSAASGPHKQHTVAYATLCIGDGILPGSLVLYHSLKQAKAKADFIAMTYNVSEDGLKTLHIQGIRTYPVLPLDVRTYITSRVQSMEQRDWILWTKLRIWQMEDYEKVILMDSDLMVLKNVDELFQMPELSASAMSEDGEKIQFYSTSTYGLSVRNQVGKYKRTNLIRGWSGLNSGVTVLKPSNETFNLLLNELSVIPNRPCCPSQEFLSTFLKNVNAISDSPDVYNNRSPWTRK
ncbi:nucleotide-diphospho-sugar transferase [Chytridium lagenaria]|nr:nucleotide-diphospho-sugar transferase [Chytridium lagenaria]